MTDFPDASEPNTGTGAVSHSVRPRVTDVDVVVIDDDPLYAYLYPEFADCSPAELVIAEVPDDAWYEATGLEWSRKLREQVRSALPQKNRLPRHPISVVGDLGPQVDDGIAALLEHNEPPVFFRRASVPMEIRYDEADVPSAAVVSRDRMRDRQRDVAEWYQPTKAGDVPVKPPGDVCGIILQSQNLHLPPLRAIVEHPVMSPRGIRVLRGYDPESQTFFAPSLPLGLLNVPQYPDGDQLRAALSRIDEMVTDFPFASPPDKANTVAMMLTPILRPIIRGNTPLAAVRAVKPGSGKTLLVQVMLRTLTGRDEGFTSLGTDENEAEKRLLADLMKGGQFIIFDNVQTGSPLGSATLARALTNGSISGRIIQTSRHVTVPVRCSFIATGNGLSMSDEIARRSYLVELEVEQERPEDRTDFLHPQLLEWVAENRPTLLSALLVVTQAWYTAGMPITSGPRLSSFEEWSRVVGSVLRHAAEAGWVDGREFLANEERKREIVEDERNDHRWLLVKVLRDYAGEREFTLRQLHKDRLFDEDVTHAVTPFLPDNVSWADDRAVVKLGYQMRSLVDGVYGNLRLRAERRGGQIYYRVVQQ